MTARFPEEVHRLRAAIAPLRALACDMQHESSRQEGGKRVRPPLCPARRRFGNLACSHTSARLLLRDAWLLLEKAGDTNAPEQLALLAKIDYEISILDYRRYDAEAAGDAAAVADCIASHRSLGEEIEALKATTLAALDAAWVENPVS